LLAALFGTGVGEAMFTVDRVTWNEGVPITAVRLTYGPGYRMETSLLAPSGPPAQERGMTALPHVGDMRVIDMHVHIGPEFLRRRYNAQSLAEEARREGFGVVMKNHFQPTTAQVSQLRRLDDEVALIGSVALNLVVSRTKTCRRMPNVTLRSRRPAARPRCSPVSPCRG
jgi:hypothetical protein